MKRSILSMTTAILLTLPAASHADVEETVIDVLEQNGYPAASVEMLTQAEMANIYLTATSEDASDVTEVLSGIDFTMVGDEMTMPAPPSDIEMEVAEVLERNGYSGAMVNVLSSSDMVAIYLAATSEDGAATSDAIASAIEAAPVLVTDDPSDAEERAMMYLMREGYSAPTVQAVGQAELIAVYLALTTGDQGEIDRAVDSAIAS